MRWKISHHDHDPRQIDLLAAVLLVIAIVAACKFLSDRHTQPPSRTDFIVPSQSVRW